MVDLGKNEEQRVAANRLALHAFSFTPHRTVQSSSASVERDERQPSRTPPAFSWPIFVDRHG
jgi:hypothetical protein